jgi:integrase
MLERDVLPRWRRRRARDVTARDVRRLLDAILTRGAPIQANRTLAVVRKVFNWAGAPDRALVPQSHNPCRGLERPAPERQRERVLSADELRALWRALDREGEATP